MMIDCLLFMQAIFSETLIIINDSPEINNILMKMLKMLSVIHLQTNSAKHFFMIPQTVETHIFYNCLFPLL